MYPRRRVKVLIADDDRLVRAMVRDLLAELGHRLEAVRRLDGVEKIDVLLEKPVTQQSLARAISRATRGGGAP